MIVPGNLNPTWQMRQICLPLTSASILFADKSFTENSDIVCWFLSLSVLLQRPLLEKWQYIRRQRSIFAPFEARTLQNREGDDVRILNMFLIYNIVFV